MNNISNIKPSKPKDDDHTYTDLTLLYTKQELADRITLLYRIKYETESKMKYESLHSYDLKKYNSAINELNEILAELLRDFD